VYLRTIFVFCFSLLSFPCCAQFGKQFYFMQFSVDLSANPLRRTEHQVSCVSWRTGIWVSGCSLLLLFSVRLSRLLLSIVLLSRPYLISRITELVKITLEHVTAQAHTHTRTQEATASHTLRSFARSFSLFSAFCFGKCYVRNTETASHTRQSQKGVQSCGSVQFSYFFYNLFLLFRCVKLPKFVILRESNGDLRTSSRKDNAM